jgi:RNase P/RNase MRP subunit p29
MAQREGGSSKKDSESSTLSRSSLYAPLSAYQSGTLKIPNRTAKSQSEAALVDWLLHISADYHKSCRPGDPRNTGNRCMTKSDVREKMLHRTLNLGSKDYAASLGGSSRHVTAKPPCASKKRSRKRKRSSKTVLVLEDRSAESQAAFLHELNELWTNYMHKFVRTTSAPLSSDESGSITNEMGRIVDVIRKCAEQLEWVGAEVRIEESLAYADWVGRRGILVAVTKNTIVLVAEMPSRDSPARLTQLTLPKRGASLTVFLKLPSSPATNAEPPATLRIRLKCESIT